MTEKRFTAIRKKNPVSKRMGNYIQENGTTILKLSSLEDCKDVCEVLNEQHETIEQLKKELKDYHNAFDCSQCKYQNYDWFDDGDEFEVCDKGNNEAQMDNHSCTDWMEL